MSCLNANIQLLTEPLVLSVGRTGELSAEITMASKRLSMRVIDTVKHLNVRASIVCSVKELGRYLKVSPEDIQWITPDYGIIYSVESDSDWIIVTA